MPLYHGKKRIGNVGVKFEKNDVNTSDATITSGAQMLEGVTAYGKDGKITGTIPSQQANAITPNDNSQIAISAGVYAEGTVTVNAVPTETKNITSNGTYTPTAGNYFSSVSVNIPEEVFETQSKNINPTESQQIIVPDANYDGLSSVTINAIPSNYVGSGVTRQANKTITPTKSAQTAIQAGSYAEGAVTVEAIPSEYIITSDATATDADIAYGKTAYVNGSKITGTHECSGGSSVNVETCTVVTLPFNYNSTARYVGYDLTVVNDGAITVESAGSGTTINNVVCGSLLYIDSSISSIASSKFRLDGEEPYSYSPDGYILFSVPYKNGETIYITVQ